MYFYKALSVGTKMYKTLTLHQYSSIVKVKLNWSVSYNMYTVINFTFYFVVVLLNKSQNQWKRETPK